MYAKVYKGTINLTTTGENYPMLAGNLTSILVSAFIVVVAGLLKPDSFTWKETRDITMVEVEDTGARLAPHT